MTNLKLRNSLATPILVIKVIISLDLSQVVVLKKYKHEISHILAEHLNMCMKDSCFSDYWNPSSMVTVFNNFEYRSVARKNHSVSLRYVLSTVFEKLVNNKVVNHHEKLGLFSDF